ncbi:MAG: MBL fold metallo-hydrolase [Gemmatimonadales bacterium]
MIRLFALASGSRGNSFALESPDGVLLLDAGLSARETMKRAERVGLDLAKVVGIALTHEHGDHASGAVRLAARLGVPIVATEGTLRALGVWEGEQPVLVLRGSSVTELAGFSLGCCRLLHDAAEPAAVVVEARDVRVGIAYDFGRPTVGLRYLLRDLDGIVLESNYDEVLLRTSQYPASVQHRIAGSGGHMSNRATAELLGELIHPDLSLVVLAHLSQQSNTPEVARATVGSFLKERGYRGQLAVAVQDEPIGPLTIRPGALKSTQVELELT